MKQLSVRLIVLLSLIAGLVFVFFSLRLIYTSSVLFQSQKMEAFREAMDEKGKRLFNSRDALFLWINSYVFDNGDKYVFRPPRIIRTNAIRGYYGYGLYGMVVKWDPASRIITVNSYLGKTISVRFDPTRDGSFAFLPQLDNQGNVIGLPDSTHAGVTDGPGFASLFCPSDIVLLITDVKDSLFPVRVNAPVVPREIRLSQRICTQTRL